MPSSKLSELLDVSEATVRRDLEWLESEGVLERTHGGAVLSQRLRYEPEYMQRAEKSIEEKRAIGRVAAGLIADGDTVFINSGTTTTHLLHQIPPDANICVVTNNLQAVLEVGEVSYELIVLGGNVQSKSNSVTGKFALDNLNQVYANKTFVSVDGFSLKYGCTVPSSSESELDRAMLKRTKGELVLLADHTKWGIVSQYEIARLEEFNKMIIDDGLDPVVQEELSSLQNDLMIVEKSITIS
jgi:DeoR/GlpR family transcriptional regulator of sugar metabolism